MNTSEHAARWATRWVLYYTRRLPARVAWSRRDELASDVWEQCHDAQDDGISDLALALSIGRRVVGGVPADLSWRFAQRMAAQGRSVDHRVQRGEAAMTVGQAGGVWVRQQRRTRKCRNCGRRYGRKLASCPICKTKTKRNHDDFANARARGPSSI